MAINPPSVRYTAADLGAVPDTCKTVILNHDNAITDIYQAIAQLKAGTSTTNETVNETVIGTSGGGGNTTAGVTSFNSETGEVSYFPDLGLVNDQTGNTTYTTQNGDNGGLVLVGASSAVSITLNYSVGQPYFTTITNYGPSDATIYPDTSVVPSTINGNASLTLPAGSFVSVYFNSPNWIADAPGSTAGGVTKIIAGSNIALSPVEGTGVVTISSSGGGGGGTPSLSNVLSYRSFGTPYQNTTAYTMDVYMYATVFGGSTGALIFSLGSTSTTIVDLLVQENTASVAATQVTLGQVSVPSSWWYQFDGSGDISGVQSWYELTYS